MTCVHLQKLYDLCNKEELKISGGDLVHLVCTQCNKQEVCPSLLMESYESTHPDEEADESQSEEQAAGSKNERQN